MKFHLQTHDVRMSVVNMSKCTINMLMLFQAHRLILQF